MSSEKTRRRYLRAAGVATLAGLAGCTEGLTGDTADEGTDDGEPESTTTPTERPAASTVPAWTAWIPAASVTSESVPAFALDIQKARSELPQATYEEFSLPQIVDLYGLDPSDMGYLGGTDPDVGDGIDFLTGAFDEADIRSNLDISASEADSYRGYTVVDDLAFGDEAIISSNHRTALDTRYGSSTGLDAAGENWTALLSTVGDGTLVGVQAESFIGDSSLSFSVPRSGLEIDADGNGGAILTGHLMFDSERRAETVLDDYERQIRDKATAPAESLQRLEQEGTRIVLTLQTDSFDFGTDADGDSRL